MGDIMSIPDFHGDLRFGQEGEVYVNYLLTAPIESVEVKRDRRWKETGNIYIETECWSDVLECWYQSGINARKEATHWSFVLEDAVVIFPIETFRKAIAMYGIKREMNRAEYSTKGFTITVADLLKVTSHHRQSASQSQST
jgi:hypothetical protein